MTSTTSPFLTQDGASALSFLGHLSSRQDLPVSMRIAIGEARELLVDLRASAPPLGAVLIESPSHVLQMAISSLNRDVRRRGSTAWRSQAAGEVLRAAVDRGAVQP